VLPLKSPKRKGLDSDFSVLWVHFDGMGVSRQLDFQKRLDSKHFRVWTTSSFVAEDRGHAVVPVER
jgi:hypothetical protein